MKEYKYIHFDKAARKYLLYRLIFPLGSLLIGFAIIFCIIVYLAPDTELGHAYYGDRKVGAVLLCVMLFIPVIQFILSKFFQYEGFAAQTIYAEDNTTIGVITVGLGKHTKPELVDVDNIASGITYQIYTYRLLKVLQAQENIISLLDKRLENTIVLFDMFTVQNVHCIKKNLFGYKVVADILHQEKPIRNYKMRISFKYIDVEHLIERLSSFKTEK